MLDVTADLKAAITAGNEAKVKTIGTKASSLDKQALGKLTSDLTNALNEIATKEK